jgi:hypothetical protein
VTKKLAAPDVPAGTSAAFATTRPANELSVETRGRGAPVGHAVRNASGDAGATVTFIE